MSIIVRIGKAFKKGFVGHSVESDTRLVGQHWAHVRQVVIMVQRIQSQMDVNAGSEVKI